jgi:hypothetical protein
MKRNMSKVTADYAVLATDEILFCDSSSAITVTLPHLTDAASRVLEIKNQGAGAVTVSPEATEMIDDDTNDPITLEQYEALTIACDGSDWWIL